MYVYIYTPKILYLYYIFVKLNICQVVVLFYCILCLLYTIWIYYVMLHYIMIHIDLMVRCSTCIHNIRTNMYFHTTPLAILILTWVLSL